MFVGTIQAQEVANPDLVQSCGLDIALVLDESGSIQDQNAINAVRQASKSFVGALSGTGSSVSIVEFNTRARTVLPLTEVTDSSMQSFYDYIDATSGNPDTGYDPSVYTNMERGTNWEDAFRTTASNQSTPLLVFVTDGDPTFWLVDPDNTAIGGVGYDTGNNNADSANQATPVANAIKQNGTHILMIGVGPGLSGAVQQGRLMQVSGPDLVTDLTSFDLATTDVMVVSDFASSLSAVLRQIVVSLCAPSITFQKLAKDIGESAYSVESGWTFSGTVQTNDGTPVEWITPNAGSTAAEQSGQTDENGEITFHWVADSDVAFTWDEDLQDFSFVDGQCSKRTFESDGHVDSTFATIPLETFVVSDSDYISCVVRNERHIVVNTCDDGKPAGLVFRYDGSGAEDDTNSQLTNELIVEGDPMSMDPVFIEVFDHKGVVLFAGTVGLNDTFQVSGTKRLIPPRMRFLVYDAEGGSVLQTVQFHTSCSQPLNTGDSFGSIVLVGETQVSSGGNPGKPNNGDGDKPENPGKSKGKKLGKDKGKKS